MPVRCLLILLFSVLPAAAQTQRTLTVALAGKADFHTVQSAVDSAPEGNIRVQIAPGTYREVINISEPHVTLIGMGPRPGDVTLTFGNSHGMAGGTSKSASVTVSGDDFLAENLTFQNSFARDNPAVKSDAQAVALLALGDRQVYRNVRLLGAQDTLYANSKTCHTDADFKAQQPCRASRQYFANCYIEGHVDFIFGDAKAVFNHCEIHALAHALITITAQSRLYPAEDSGYLFLDSTVTGDPDAHNILFGRPWRAYSTVDFLNTDFKAPLSPDGWAEWDARLATSSYAEFGTHGNASDFSQRINGVHKLTAAEAAKLTVADWLAGPDHWNPEAIR